MSASLRLGNVAFFVNAVLQHGRHPRANFGLGLAGWRVSARSSRLLHHRKRLHLQGCVANIKRQTRDRQIPGKKDTHALSLSLSRPRSGSRATLPPSSQLGGPLGGESCGVSRRHPRKLTSRRTESHDGKSTLLSSALKVDFASDGRESSCSSSSAGRR